MFVTDDGQGLIIRNLISKNTLISASEYTDGIDYTLLKILRSKKKKVKIVTP